MSRVEQLQKQIAELSVDELKSLREWLSRYDTVAWDRQFEADRKRGTLARLADRALHDHEAGQSTEL